MATGTAEAAGRDPYASFPDRLRRPGSQESFARELAVQVDAAGVAHVSADAGREALQAALTVSPGAAGPHPRSAAATAAEGRGVEPGPGAEGNRLTCAPRVPPLPAEAEALVRRVAESEDFYPDFVLSVARIESHFHADQVSPKGAVGLMQLMPSTAARYGVDICDPADNVRGGVRFLRALHDRYRNPFYMLAAYNAGEDSVEQYRGVPPFPETVRYVADVINDFYALPPPGAKAPGIAGKRTPTRRSVAAAQPEAGWSQGFVMHVEN